jgi:hypothetical protein
MAGRASEARQDRDTIAQAWEAKSDDPGLTMPIPKVPDAANRAVIRVTPVPPERARIDWGTGEGPVQSNVTDEPTMLETDLAPVAKDEQLSEDDQA